MTNRFKHHAAYVLLAPLMIAMLIAPLTMHAQESDLTATIRAEIMKDPRAAGIPQAQMDAMVAALAQSAAEQGVTSDDITWRPAEADTSAVPAECGFFCYVNAIFGFGGSDYTIPLGLALSSAILILIISMMLHRHHAHGVHPTIEAIHTHPLH